jgi:hypothetical protein
MQFDFVLYAEPFPEADYSDPRLKCVSARYNFTADDLLKLHGGRAVAWVVPRQTRAVRQKILRAAPQAYATHLLAPRATKIAPNWGPNEVALSSALTLAFALAPTLLALALTFHLYLHLHLHLHLPLSPAPVPASPPPPPTLSLRPLDPPHLPVRWGSVTHCITSTGAHWAGEHQKRAFGVCLPASVCSGLGDGVCSVAAGGVHIYVAMISFGA